MDQGFLQGQECGNLLLLQHNFPGEDQQEAIDLFPYKLGIFSHSFQTEVEVITVEEEVGDVGEEWCARLKNLPTNITVERQKDEVGCIIYSCTLFYVLYILQASLEREDYWRNNDPGCQQAR